jgi:DNA-binding beta-propeller fold protein YncE
MARKKLVLALMLLVGLSLVRAPLWGQAAGGFGYVANCAAACSGVGPGNVSAYAIAGTTGALTPISGSPFPAGVGPSSVTVHPTGPFAYVANGAADNVSAYTIAGTTGTLTPIPGSPFPAGTQAISVTLDPTGQFAYVANAGSNSVSAYLIDGTTGALTPVAGSPFPAGSRPASVTTAAGPAPPPRATTRPRR